MKVGDRIVYRELYGDRIRRPGRIEADGSRGGDGPPFWIIRLDDGISSFPVDADAPQLEPEPAVDQLARLAPDPDGP